MADKGRGVRNPQLLLTLFSFAALLGLTAADNFQGETGQRGSAAIFFLTQECQYKKRGCYSPWHPWAEPQPPPVRGVIAHTQKISGENRTAWKRCRLFLGPGMPVQKRGRDSPWCPWAKPQPPPVGASSPTLTAGSSVRRSWAGPLKKRRKAERCHSSSALTM